MTLHIINQSPSQGSKLKDCIDVLRAEDCIVLIENGAYTLQLKEYCEALEQAGAECFVIADDAAARGLKNMESISAIDYPRFVELCTQHSPIQSW